MINFTTDINIKVSLTEEEFREAAKSTIDFAVYHKDYGIESIDPAFIAEDITGIIVNHGLSKEALSIISEEIEAFKKKIRGEI